MIIRDFDRWVILRPRFYQGFLWIEYEDEVGTIRSIPSYEAGQPIPPGWLEIADFPSPGTQAYLVPQDLEFLMESGFADRPEERDGVPWLLPVFVDPPRGIESLPWERILADGRFRIPDRCVLLRLAHKTWQPRPAAQLPLTVLDASEPGGNWLAALRAHSWYADEPAVQTHGLRLEQLGDRGGGKVRDDPSPHIVLARLDGAERLIKGAWSAGRTSSRPRLVVVVNEKPLEDALLRLAAEVPAGCSLLILELPGWILPADHDNHTGNLVEELVYAVVHDFALHYLVWKLQRQFSGQSAFLISDPAAIQDLRMSRTMRQMVDESLSVVHPVMGGDVDAFASRLDKDLAAAVKPLWDEAQPEWKEITEHKFLTHNFSFDFSRETRGLVPMVYFSVQKSAVKEASSRLTEKVKSMPCVPECLEQIGQNQTRRADIGLEEYDAFGVLRPMGDYDRQWPLRAGGRYRLRVHIGQPDENSIVEGEVSSIDPLLPEIDEKERYKIDVVVFEKTFGLRSAGIKTLELPKLGGSKPVYFELQAPSSPGPADLRVGLYLRNCLLQSFVLEAEVSLEAERIWTQTTQVWARQTFSTTARFGNLDELSDPAMSIAMNQDRTSGTHTLMLKGGNVRLPLTVTEKQIETHMRDFRNLLEEAALDGQQPRFPVDEALNPDREKEFSAYLRRLAQIGSGIYGMLVQPANRKACQAINQLLGETGLTVQFIRLGTNLPFPWQLVYDYSLPEGDDFVNSRVCFADKPRLQPASLEMQGCPHCPGEAVICIEGFWSARHCLEQLSKPPTGQPDDGPQGSEPVSEDLVTTIAVPKGNPLVCLGTGVNDLSAQGLSESLSQGLAHDLKLLTPEEDLVNDVLWKETERPGLLIVLGHLEPGDETRNLPPRILPVILPENFTRQRHLSETNLRYAKVQRNPWSAEPRTMVLLMACQSAQTQLEDLTNFIDTFMGVGAAGIAGTENSVCSDLAALFAERLVLGMAKKGLCLGEVRRSFTLEMLRQGNPLPFSFTVFGSANLTIERIERP